MASRLIIVLVAIFGPEIGEMLVLVYFMQKNGENCPLLTFSFLLIKQFQSNIQVSFIMAAECRASAVVVSAKICQQNKLHKVNYKNNQKLFTNAKH